MLDNRKRYGLARGAIVTQFGAILDASLFMHEVPLERQGARQSRDGAKVKRAECEVLLSSRQSIWQSNFDNGKP